MINNQFSRRNLTNIQKAELAIEMEKIEQVQAKARQGARNDKPSVLRKINAQRIFL